MAQEHTSKILKGWPRRVAKSMAVKTGGLSLFHRVKHGEALTVLMFHRVLPQNLIAAYNADRNYTISAQLLESLVPFIAKHYSIVSLPDVIQSRNRRVPLPSRPLLITFDDGWEDNVAFAAPILAKMNVPWTLFVATGAIDAGTCWWQETLLAGLRSGAATYETLKDAALALGSGSGFKLPNDPALRLLVLYGHLPPANRDNLIATLCGNAVSASRPQDMASWASLQKLRENGVAIGGHGTSHLPLTMVKDPQHEIRDSKQTLEKYIKGETCVTMSFPHGVYDPTVVQAAREEGMELLFTSDPVLNICTSGWVQSDLIGRISVQAADVADSAGELRADLATPWLMLRQQVVL